MLYTNGKKLISSSNDAEELHKAVRKLKNHMFEEYAIEADFQFDDTLAYPCYVVPKGVDYTIMDKVLRPRLSLRAIDEDIIVLPEPKEITVAHHYTPQEMQKLGESMASKVLERNKVNGQKAAAMAEFTSVLKGINKDLDELATNHDNGYEEREYLVEVRLNFAEGVKYMVDKKSGEIRDTAPMEPRDFQMRIDTTREEIYNPEEPDGEPGDADGDENGPAGMVGSPATQALQAEVDGFLDRHPAPAGDGDGTEPGETYLTGGDEHSDGEAGAGGEAGQPAGDAGAPVGEPLTYEEGTRPDDAAEGEQVGGFEGEGHNPDQLRNSMRVAGEQAAAEGGHPFDHLRPAAPAEVVAEPPKEKAKAKAKTKTAEAPI